MWRMIIVLSLVSIGCYDTRPGGRWDRYDFGARFGGASPEISPDGTKMIYSSPFSGHGDIYCHDTATKHDVQLTSSRFYEGDASWSHDASEIVFTKENENHEGRIWVMDSAGDNQKQLTFGPGYDHTPSFSPDGQVIVFSRSAGRGAFPTYLCILDRTDGRVRQLTSGRLAFDNFGDFGSSNNELFYSSEFHIVSLSIDSGVARTICEGDEPHYVPQSNSLVYLYQNEDFDIGVRMLDLDTQKMTELTPCNGYKSGISVLSKDSQTVPTVYYLDEPRARGVGSVIEISANGHSTVLDISPGSTPEESLPPK